MKFTLKDYQADAVDDLLHTLERAKDLYYRDGIETSVSLSATTGAGKTVMAAAVIEALFYGNDDLGFEADPSAVIVWFSDDPNLNDQTRFRLTEASDKLATTDLVTIQAPFSKPRLEPGKVYFLNTGKLTKSSLLTRGHVDVDHEVLPTMTTAAQPDLQGWTIWETIANTIDADLTLYLVIDEAHRGFNTKTSRDKATIVSKLVNGQGTSRPIPIVWGISATIQRFKDAMEEANAVAGRRVLPPVTVDGFRVQESGLVKDAVVLDIPAEAGNFDTVLVRRAAKKLRASSERWERYAVDQKTADVVRPLLVLQAPNTPDHDQLGRALDEVFAEFPEFGTRSVRHVFGDHTTQKFGTWDVDWIEPQLVQDRTEVRVLVAKDAISTGWDCPRAEVMVSFRPAKDATHITQLLGRMVRSPLARRVPGDEELNSVECILPFFDRTTAGNVVKLLTGQITDVTPPKKTIIDPCHLVRNDDLPEAVWECWNQIPTQTVPQRGAAPVKRLVSLALQLSTDGLRPGAVADAEREMHRVLDAARVRHPDLLDDAVSEIWAVRGQSITGRTGSKQLTYRDFVERADDRAIQVGFGDAKKAFGSDVAQSYVNHVAGEDGDDDGLRDAFVVTAALATVPAVRATVDREADDLAARWFAEYRVASKELSDDRQQEYQDILALAVEPQRGELGELRTGIEDYVEIDGDAQYGRAPLVDLHLLADGDGKYPVGSLNEWERELVTKELARTNAVAWYRNPARRSVDSLSVAYRDGFGNWRSMHPDFVFFNDVGGSIRASIVDPHGHHLEDSLVKLQGLARFAAEFGDDFHRVEAVTKIGGKWRVLDVKRASVRDAVLASSESPQALYESDVSADYV